MKLEITVLTIDGQIKFTEDINNKEEVSKMIELLSDTLDLVYVNKEKKQKEFDLLHTKNGKINA